MPDLAPRKDFPVLSREIDGTPLVYLDSAATSLKPRSVIAATSGYYEKIGANIHRGKHILSDEASDAFEGARRKVARFFSAQANEVVLTHNATHALNLVALGLPLPTGARILVAADAHHSAILPWRRRGEVELVDAHDDLERTLARYDDALAKNPAVVVLTHCSNVSGVYFPVAEMAARAKEKGAIVVVDAAQSAPHRKISTTTLHADFLAVAGHKMLAPSGTGLLIGDAERLELLDPTFAGGGSVDWVDVESSRWRALPHRLEAGTPHIAGVIGLGAAVDYLERLGMAAVETHDADIGIALRREARRRPKLRVVEPAGEAPHAALVSLVVEGTDKVSDIARSLSDSYGVMARSGYLCAQPYVTRAAGREVLRLSAYVYNDDADVVRAFEALDELLVAYA